MPEKKIVYFEETGEKNTEKALEAAFERLKEGDIKYVVIATHRGNTALKAAKKFEKLPVELIAVTICVQKPEIEKEWNENLPKIQKLGIKTHRGVYPFSAVDRAVKKRWGGVGPCQLIADTFRILGEGVKVGMEIVLMATDAGLVKEGEKVLTIAGSSRGADCCLVIKAVHSRNLYETAIKEIVCKPYTDGIKHEAR